MFKYAVIFLIVPLIAGAFGLTNVSQVAMRVSMGEVLPRVPRAHGHCLSDQRGDRPTRPALGCNRIRINRA
jgi:hypothetical protein